jgi:SOS-response transcriptional repressor LexA
MESSLTKKQQKILTFIARSVCKLGYQPSYREIAKRFGYGSASAVSTHLAACERKGACVRRGSRAVQFQWRKYL